MAETAQVLIAGIGNIFFGDDAFGCELLRRLEQMSWPPQVILRDFGIRGIDLAYALMEPHQHVILIDAVPRGGQPGTLYFIRPEIGTEVGPVEADPAAPGSPLDAHSLDPEKVLRLAASWGADISDIVLVGCEPEPYDFDKDMPAGLSEPVRATLDEAAHLVQVLVERYLAGDGCELSNLRKYMETVYH